MSSNEIIVRPALETDARRVWEIRNSPEVRSNSENSEEITLEKHLVWFAKKYFSNQKNLIFILDFNRLAVGYCRLDFDAEENFYIISIAIDPAYRGRGWGQTLLKRSLLLAGPGKKFVAKILEHNLPSLKIFEKSGFVVYQKDGLVYSLRI